MRLALSEQEKEALKKLKELVETLSRDELAALRYIWEFISVGEIIAEKELQLHYGIEKPAITLKRLREKQLIERGEGCYNLASWLRPLRKKVSNLDLLLRTRV